MRPCTRKKQKTSDFRDTLLGVSFFGKERSSLPNKFTKSLPFLCYNEENPPKEPFYATP